MTDKNKQNAPKEVPKIKKVWKIPNKIRGKDKKDLEHTKKMIKAYKERIQEWKEIDERNQNLKGGYF
jgi:peptidoglycan hydrolase CwlO-like protein